MNAEPLEGPLWEDHLPEPVVVDAYPLEAPSALQLQLQLVETQEAYWQQIEELVVIVERIKRFERSVFTVESLGVENAALLPDRNYLTAAIQRKDALSREIETLSRLIAQQHGAILVPEAGEEPRSISLWR